MSPALVDTQFGVLSLSEPAEVSAFENAFYAAFSFIGNQALIRQIWNWNDAEESISLKVHYRHTLITYQLNTEGEVSAYVVGYEPGHFSQFEFYGFNAPAYAGNYFEVAALFATIKGRNKGIWLKEHFIKPFCIPLLVERGFHCMLATCAPKLLPMYMRWGWKLLESKTIESETRHFLYYDLR